MSEGGFHKAPTVSLVSYPLNRQLGESLGVHTAIYKFTRIYNLHRSTRLTTSQDIHPYIQGTVFITFLQMLTTSRQCSHTWSIQPCLWAIQLHHHSMKRCDSSFSSSNCSKISTMFRQCLTINGIEL